MKNRNLLIILAILIIYVLFNLSSIKEIKNFDFAEFWKNCSESVQKGYDGFYNENILKVEPQNNLKEAE